MSINQATDTSVHPVESRPATEPLVCNLTAIPSVARAEHASTTAALFAAVEAVQELPDGYAVRLPNQDDLWLTAARFIDHERRCCAFLNFELTVAPFGGPIWLRLTGEPGVKPLLQQLLETHTQLATPQAEGTRGSTDENTGSVAEAQP